MRPGTREGAGATTPRPLLGTVGTLRSGVSGRRAPGYSAGAASGAGFSSAAAFFDTRRFFTGRE
ncbi:hypothetical protein GCM10009605_15210 [Nocardiopsis composta]